MGRSISYDCAHMGRQPLGCDRRSWTDALIYNAGHLVGATWVRYFVKTIVLLSAALLIVVMVGVMMPAVTLHSKALTLKASPPEVFEVLSDFEAIRGPNRNTVNIEFLSKQDGNEAIVHTTFCDVRVTVNTIESRPPDRLVRIFNDAASPFCGSWTYAITETPGGCRVCVTQRSSIRKPLLRVIHRVIGPTALLERHLKDVARRFGETPGLQQCLQND